MPKPVFYVFGVAFASVVCIGALDAIGVDAPNAGNHHCSVILDGLEIIPKLRVGAVGLSKAKSYYQLVRGRVN